MFNLLYRQMFDISSLVQGMNFIHKEMPFFDCFGQVKYIDCYTVTARELESITARYKLSAIMSGTFSLPFI